MASGYEIQALRHDWEQKNKGKTPEELIAHCNRIVVEEFNNREGRLTGIDCPKCKNRGAFYRLDDNGANWHVEECECMKARREVWQIERSGLGESLNKCTLESFETKTDLQKLMKRTAEKYLVDSGKGWLFVGGQVGSGKTHICTAVVGELLHKGVPARYVRWKEIARKLKQVRFDEQKYDEQMSILENIQVLYIDDLFKGIPTEADVGIVYDILNYRYAENKPTIISSEKTVAELMEIDEAVASRIIEMSGEYCLNISKDGNKNMRLK